ncbi:histidine kinase [Paenibacillus darwinianus]|uniref:histidine kinase n=1 Tax=Paenibacillus darwinianus TaxID=1380763 RepID=A0A9W5S1B6_9BACL|nr:sensor histidine kinase [Paenibacillus darwinianus]EXX87138.1 histidine kinase [Paenibacillus darwinianus]EXX88814.1 histidine kinase [Paenibacillus darwinianus]EXX89703.1 histidine kinase [Paenibacillus darwinianus]
MQKWYQIFQKNTGLSPYVWVVFYILPFYFIFRSSSPYEVAIGILMIIGFFVCYVLSFVSRGWLVYFWTSVQILISIMMTLLFGYVYFALFLAFFIGNIQNRVGFFTLYSIHLLSTVFSINYGFVTQNPVFITQLPFVLVSLVAVILLPVTTYNRNKSDKLQGQLENANKRISELVKLEERQRIARDLHDTLGQKLSLIGLKSDLAGKLIGSDPHRALAEISDVRQTARMALKEVREMVTQMRGTSMEDEIFRIKQILSAAQIEFILEGDPKLTDTSLLNETVISMCLKEAITNVVRHSRATACSVAIEPSRTELVVRVKDNGIGIGGGEPARFRGHGIRGMKERLEFVNGSLQIESDNGTTVIVKVPNVVQQPEKEAGI